MLNLALKPGCFEARFNCNNHLKAGTMAKMKHFLEQLNKNHLESNISMLDNSNMKYGWHL